MGDDMDSDPDKRQRGLEVMASVYGWPGVGDGPGDFFGYTVEHLFAEIWEREGLSYRDRRLLLIGLLVGRGMDDVLGLQLEAGDEDYVMAASQQAAANAGALDHIVFGRNEPTLHHYHNTYRARLGMDPLPLFAAEDVGAVVG